MTVRLDLPPGDPSSPPHRQSRPVFGSMHEGEPERVIRAGEAFWETGGYVDDEELEQRRDRRAPRPVAQEG